MGQARTVVCALMLSGTSLAAAQPPGLTLHTVHGATPAAVSHIGLTTGVGVPDGGSVSLVVRPVRALRAELGAAHNVVSPGVRAQLTWVPFDFWVTPVASIGYGRMFERDANVLVQTVSGDPTLSSPLLSRVGYDFSNARVGLEFGHHGFTFYVHAGISRITGLIHNVDLAAADATANAMSTVQIATTDPEIRIWTVSASLGFLVYLF